MQARKPMRVVLSCKKVACAASRQRAAHRVRCDAPKAKRESAPRSSRFPRNSKRLLTGLFGKAQPSELWDLVDHLTWRRKEINYKYDLPTRADCCSRIETAPDRILLSTPRTCQGELITGQHANNSTGLTELISRHSSRLDLVHRYATGGRKAGDGYVLFRLPEKSAGGRTLSGERRIDLSRPFRFGLVKRVSGLSVFQPFGRWSDSRVAQIELFRPLPRWFDLCLTASAFGPNVQLPFEIGIGNDSKVFRLSSTPSEICVPFNTSGGETLVTIAVPQPISPKQLGMGSDDRMLGIALMKMKVIPDEHR